MKKVAKKITDNVSLTRLLAMYISPFALGHALEKIPPGLGKKEAAAIHYRNNQFLFKNLIDVYESRSSDLVVICLLPLQAPQVRIDRNWGFSSLLLDHFLRESNRIFITKRPTYSCFVPS